jgi:tetratricopeptide (TPR) repeat protein
MHDNLARSAIIAALNNDWSSALEANLEILNEEPNDTNALNRSARAYLQLGDIGNAVRSSEKVLKLDPVNSIAMKCISKCAALKSNGSSHKPNNVTSIDNVFLEIPGKTKIVSLINLCDISTLAMLSAGESVHILPKLHKVSVTNLDEIYIGRLPDDLATRMIYFFKNGNEYNAFIKSVSNENVTVFIKEIKKSPNLNHIHSFPIRRFA